MWNERLCVGISFEDAEALQNRAECLYHDMITLTNEAIEERHLNDFDFSLEEARTISRSWEMSDYAPTLFTRIDYLVSRGERPRFIGMASGLSALLLETAVAQWDWLVEMYPGATQFNTISERLMEAWREYHLTGRKVHVAYDPNDVRDLNIAEYLAESASLAGVNAVATPVGALSLASDQSGIVDVDGDSVDVLITEWESFRLSGESLWKASDRLNVCLVEPHWKRLWKHPHWLAYCRRRVSSARDFVEGTPSTLHSEGAVICSVWLVAGKVSGLGFSSSINVSRAGVREFIPHLLM
jgi:glutathionylspermidine synthase